MTKMFTRRLRETHEHKPQELRITINGFLVSSLRVSSDLSELNLNLCVVVIAGFLFFKASLSRTLSASSLLEKASVAEKSANGMPDRVRHRFINLEERRSAEGAIVAQHRIEICAARRHITRIPVRRGEL